MLQAVTLQDVQQVQIREMAAEKGLVFGNDAVSSQQKMLARNFAKTKARPAGMANVGRKRKLSGQRAPQAIALRA